MSSVTAAVGVVARRTCHRNNAAMIRSISLASRLRCLAPRTTPGHMRGSSVLEPFNSSLWCIRTSSTSTSNNSVSGSSNEAEVAADQDKKEPLTDQQILDSVEEIVEVDSKALDTVIDKSLFTQLIPVKMPDMGTGETSKVAQWYFAPGDIVQRGNVLCDIETPGFTFGMETDDEELAIMGETLVELGQSVPVNTIICNLYHEAPAVKETETPEEPIKAEEEGKIKL